MQVRIKNDNKEPIYIFLSDKEFSKEDPMIVIDPGEIKSQISKNGVMSLAILKSPQDIEFWKGYVPSNTRDPIRIKIESSNVSVSFDDGETVLPNIISNNYMLKYLGFFALFLSILGIFYYTKKPRRFM